MTSHGPLTLLRVRDWARRVVERAIRRRASPPLETLSAPGSYRAEIDFSQEGNSEDYKIAGWSWPEPSGAWTDGRTAALRLRRPDPGLGGTLEVALFPMIKGTVKRQRVGLSVDGIRLADHVVTGPSVLRLEVPAAPDAKRETLELTIHVPDAASPASEGGSDDPRLLGVHVASLRWREAPRLRPTGAKARLLVIHDDHTAKLVDMVARCPALAEHLDVVGYPVSASSTSPPPEVADERYDLVWRQTVAQAPPERALLALAAPQGRIVSFPQLAMPILWPFETEDPRRRPEPRYPRGRYPHPDAIAATLRDEAAADDAWLLDEYLRRSADALPDAAAALGDYAQRLHWRDLDCDIQVAGFILDNFRAVPLFCAREAPTGALLRHLAVELVTRMDLEPAHRGQALIELNALAAGFAGDWIEEAPINPLVAAAFELQWCRPETKYRQHATEWTFSQYILDYIRWTPWPI